MNHADECRDLMMFKLAFHTYEALSNKLKVEKRKENLAKEMAKNSTAKKKSTASTRGNSSSKRTEDSNDNWDLISNMSGESHYTVAGNNNPGLERKLQMYSESLDVKLNVYLKKW